VALILDVWIPQMFCMAPHVYQQQAGAAADGGLKESLLAAVNHAHHFDVAVAAAMQQVGSALKFAVR
jgi:hypothetical protein